MRRLGTINNIEQILKKYGLYANKNFGQNFLVDQNILERIVKECHIDKNINVIEIGPGLGSLTEHLLENANHVLAYEIDKKLIPVLNDLFKDYDNFTLLNQDILKSDINSDIKKYFDDKPVYIVSNLPYYITTPIIMHILESNIHVKRLVFMMQKEVADRITACRGGKDYNNLSLTIEYYANSYKAFDVSRNVFIPKPNVDSSIVVLDIPEQRKYNVIDEPFFLNLIRVSFANRRKTLVNNLNNFYKLPKDKLEGILKELNIDPLIRSEALVMEDFIKLERKLRAYYD